MNVSVDIITEVNNVTYLEDDVTNVTENIITGTVSVDGVFRDVDVFGKHEFINTRPWTAVPTIIILSIASFVGTAGNIMILLAIASSQNLRNVEAIFIVNLAISDLYVTLIADPMSIVAKLEGEHFFDSVPNLCQTVASLCTISCVTSLMTIAAMSFNRYIYVCKSDYYHKVFTKRNSVIICCSLYGVGVILVLLNQFGIGDHSFDRKSLECIWDRMASFSYTVVFSVTLVWIPCFIIGVCYLKLYLFVKRHKQKLTNHRNGITNLAVSQIPSKPQPQLGKTFILIYAVFVTCWAPYALLIVLDLEDSFPHEVHLYITIFAHLHPSINWLIYYLTHRKLALAFCKLLGFKSRPNLSSSGKNITFGDTQVAKALQRQKASDNNNKPDASSVSGDVMNDVSGDVPNDVSVIKVELKTAARVTFQGINSIHRSDDSGIECQLCDQTQGNKTIKENQEVNIDNGVVEIHLPQTIQEDIIPDELVMRS